MIVRPRPNLSARAAAGNTVAALTIVKTLATHDKSAARVVGNERRSSGNITVMLDNRSVTMGLMAAHKIWVYDPADDPERPAVRRPRAAAKAGR